MFDEDIVWRIIIVLGPVLLMVATLAWSRKADKADLEPARALREIESPPLAPDIASLDNAPTERQGRR
jgi:hypothetical protein